VSRLWKGNLRKSRKPAFTYLLDRGFRYWSSKAHRGDDRLDYALACLRCLAEAKVKNDDEKQNPFRAETRIHAGNRHAIWNFSIDRISYNAICGISYAAYSFFVYRVSRQFIRVVGPASASLAKKLYPSISHTEGLELYWGK